MAAAPLRSLLAAVVLAILLYLLSRHLRHSTDKRQRRSPKKTASSRRPALKGVAPKKIDTFTARVCAAHPDITADEARRRFPRKYEVHGHVVVVRLNEGTTVEEVQSLARYFAAAFAPVLVDVVLLDSDGIVGELRRPSLHMLYQADTAVAQQATTTERALRQRWSDARKLGCPPITISVEDLGAVLKRWTASSTFTTHVENGVIYGLDVNRVMFCSGNTTERMHFAGIKAVGEVVVDMFCGIGYFTLPLAMHGCVAAIHALEKNPDSIDFIRINAVLNRVDHLIHPYCGDNREVGDELFGKCDRVLMGYIPSSKPFLPRAVSFLKKNAAGRPCGIVHYHFLADKPAAAHDAIRDVTDELGTEVAAAVRIAELRCVKSYAPKRFHYVADLSFQ